ncbi:MAG: UTRA domain-containing protein [Betaproteobacteria bacterium]|nr:UTRA domain-containing protein [Betaproteobacteria bacterium]
MNRPAKQVSAATSGPAQRQVPDRGADQAWLGVSEKLGPGAVVTGPLYAEVKRRVLQSLMEGEWPQGAPIPTEARLAQRYGVSVGTVRKALGELVGERVLVRRAGRGTFAARHDRDHMLEAFFNIVNAERHKEFPASELLSFRRTAADAGAARHLQLAPGAPVITFEHLLSLQGEPVIYDDVAVPQVVFPELDEKLLRHRDTTIFGLYQMRYGVTVTQLEEWIRAAAAPPGVARHLRLKPSTAVLAIERVAYTYDDTAVEYRSRYVNTAHHAYLNVLGMNRHRR